MNGEHNDGMDSSPPNAERENASLVRAIAEGDREAERVFAVRYLPPVRAMLLARSRNPDLAADLLQEVMIEAICGLRRGQLREAAKLTPFVLGIARNVLNNHFRNAARQPESVDLPDDLPDLSSAADHDEDEQREALVLQAISGLDHVDKSILQMTLVDGLKPGVIAERLGLSSDVVRQRKVRATRRVIDFVRGLSQNPSTVHLITGREP